MLTIDGREYNVYVEWPTIKRGATLEEGDASGIAQSGRLIRDIKGTRFRYSFTVRANRLFPLDYDAVFDVLCEPVESHKILMPYGQEMREFEVAIYDVDDTFRGKSIGVQRWDSMEVSFSTMYLLE